MAKVRKKQLALLEPYLIGEEPRDNGEWDMYCPMHEDLKRSASLNITEGLWYCQAECGGGTVTQLLRKRSDWVSPPTAGSYRAKASGTGSVPLETLTHGKVQGWASALQANPSRLARLLDKRDISNDTVNRFDIGWRSDKAAYTIPVYGLDGSILNVRRYDPSPTGERRKIYSTKGYGSPPQLFPIQVMRDDPDKIVICEGEWDALLTIEHGIPAITRTASAKTWHGHEWNEYFRGRKVYICHDADETGQDANRIVAKSLAGVAAEVHIVKLPYRIVPKHGKDLSDFWQEGASSDDFWRLAEAGDRYDQATSSEPEDVADVRVIDATDAARVGKPIKVKVTVTAKAQQGYTIPHKQTFECGRNNGDHCQSCPLNERWKGRTEITIEPSDKLALSLIDVPTAVVNNAIRFEHGIVQKCFNVDQQTTEYMSVERLWGQSNVDRFNEAAGETMEPFKITSVGRHDTAANSTVEVIGALHPGPKNQANEFLAWEVNPVATSLDHTDLSKKDLELLKVFRPAQGQSPVEKLDEIADELSSSVTHIHGRREMHQAVDLVFHSALAFRFGGQHIHRGWLELLIVGDTRTGKSEVSEKLIQHYRAGEMLNCESASFAGIVGGLQQFGSSKEWAISWGAIPINDRRLVVLDEIGGLTPEEIAQMSGVRSSGEAQLSKIKSAKTHARTRLIWLGNPRGQRMNEYTYGVQAIKPLIGNPEDVARFDLAMSVKFDPALSDVINRPNAAPKRPKFTSAACNALVRWVWSRTSEDVRWDPKAEQAVYKAAIKLGMQYTEDPPLIQAANVRIKLARLSVAIAARLYSSKDGHHIDVQLKHVRAAVKFINMLYGMKEFGYLDQSVDMIADRAAAEGHKAATLKFLRSYPGLGKFLRGQGKFRRQDLEEVLNTSRDGANAVINALWKWRMVRKEKGDIFVEPTLHDMLREMRDHNG